MQTCKNVWPHGISGALMIGYNERVLLGVNVALTQIHMIIIYIFRPIVAVLGYAYLKPWFQVTIIVYDSCSFNFSLVDIGVIPKA